MSEQRRTTPRRQQTRSRRQQPRSRRSAGATESEAADEGSGSGSTTANEANERSAADGSAQSAATPESGAVEEVAAAATSADAVNAADTPPASDQAEEGTGATSDQAEKGSADDGGRSPAAPTRSSSKGTASGARTKARGRRKKKRKRGTGAPRGGTWTGDVELSNGGLALADRDGALIQYAPPEMTAGLRYLVARLQRETGAEIPKRVAFTSTLSGEGVSVLARSFAAVLGHDTGRRVCLVDLNWWTFDRRTYRRSEDVHGLYEVLWMDKPLDAVLVETQSPQVSYLPAGSAPRAARPTLAQHPRLGDALEELAGRFDHLVLDVPAVTATSDAIALTQFSDQVVLVVRQGVASRSQMRTALDDLGDSRPVAAVLNRTSTSIPGPLRKLFGL
jgi:Mrp family chromosome partitioning ATPase